MNIFVWFMKVVYTRKQMNRRSGGVFYFLFLFNELRLCKGRRIMSPVSLSLQILHSGEEIKRDKKKEVMSAVVRKRKYIYIYIYIQKS